MSVSRIAAALSLFGSNFNRPHKTMVDTFVPQDRSYHIAALVILYACPILNVISITHNKEVYAVEYAPCVPNGTVACSPVYEAIARSAPDGPFS